MTEVEARSITLGKNALIQMIVELEREIAIVESNMKKWENGQQEDLRLLSNWRGMKNTTDMIRARILEAENVVKDLNPLAIHGLVNAAGKNLTT